MFTSRRQLESRNPAQAGFTLVEMLVSVALVLLMMTMFAEIFSLATSSMSKQKGLAELDQRQRLMSTLLRDDLKQRSFRTLFAYHPSDNSINVYSVNRPGNIPFDERQGYFYISENDPDNDSDDVLQFTVTRDSDSVFYGRTRELLDSQMPVSQGAASNPNQPEFDDGAYFGEGLGVGTSPSAEVAYFLRNGILYRRVLLIRHPTDVPFINDNPTTPGGVPLIQTGNGIYPQGVTSTGFYVRNGSVASRYPEDFDYSATHVYVPPPMMPPNPPPAQVTMLGETSLNPGSTLPLGDPRNRFGFQRPTGFGGSYPVGLPLEYLPTGFIGRFTHEETSHPAFAYPGDLGAGSDSVLGNGDDTNPYTRPVAGLVLGPNGVVNQFAFGSRQGEDILLTKVQGFDVKIWDPGASRGADGLYGIAFIDDDNGDGDNNNATGADDILEMGWPGSDDGAWVDIGHGGPGAIGFFAQGNNSNTFFGPLGANNRCFDTWHPSLGATLGTAPFRPATRGLDGQPGRANYDDDNADGDNDPATGFDEPAELGWPNTDDVPVTIKAIKIRVRFLDVSSGLIREISIIEQLSPEAI